MSQPQVVTINGQQYVLAQQSVGAGQPVVQQVPQQPVGAGQPQVQYVPAPVQAPTHQEGLAPQQQYVAVAQPTPVEVLQPVDVKKDTAPFGTTEKEEVPKRPMCKNHISVCSAILVIALAAACLEIDWVEVTLRGGTATFTLEDIKDLEGSIYNDLRKQAKLASAGLGMMLAGACVLLVLGAAAYVVRYYKALAFVHLGLPTFLLSLGGLLGLIGCGLVIKETEDLMDTYRGDAEYLEGEYLGFITSGICFFGGFTLAYFEWVLIKQLHGACGGC